MGLKQQIIGSGPITQPQQLEDLRSKTGGRGKPYL